MFEKVLVTTDLSNAAECVVSALGGLKEFGTRKARLVYCLNARDVGGVVHKLTELAAPTLERQQQILEDQGIETETDIAIGLPQTEIESQAKSNDCDAIVVAAHGEHVSSDILACGMASAIVHSSSLPILLLRLPCKGEASAEGCAKWSTAPLQHVLFATDFSDNSEHAYENGLRPLATRGVGEVTLMHVQDRTRIDRHLKDRLEEFNRIDTERLERLKSELVNAGVEKINIEIPYGSPKKEIIERIQKGDISLVVMGMQGRGYVGEIFLGSVGLAVARHSTAPILLVPAIS